MAIVVPTRTAGSLGTTKSNANPVTNEPQQMTAAQYNLMADKLIEVVNQSNANEATSGRILWEWNGVDLTQFGSVSVFSSGNPGTFTATPSILPGVAVSPQVSGNGLRIQSSGGGVTGTHWALLPIIQPLPQSFEIEMFSNSISAESINEGWGIFFWGDLTTSAEHGYFWQPIARKSRIDNGTVINGNTGGAAHTGFGQIRIRVEGRPAPWVDYAHGQNLIESIQGGGTFQNVLRNAYNANDGDWGFATLPPGSWAGKAGDRVGLCVVSTGGGGGTPDWIINSIRIRALS